MTAFHEKILEAELTGVHSRSCMLVELVNSCKGKLWSLRHGYQIADYCPVYMQVLASSHIPLGQVRGHVIDPLGRVTAQEPTV